MQHNPWPQKARMLTGAALLTMLVVGVWLLLPMIVYDLARMHWWQKILFWTGDFAGILFIVKWMLRPDSHVDVSPNHDSSSNGFSGKALGIALVLSLMLDIFITGLSLYSSKQGMSRSLPATANVLSTSTSTFRESNHYRIDFSFKTQNEIAIETYLTFATLSGRNIEHWEEAPMMLFAKDPKPKNLEIVFDPELPKRVWFKDQPWASSGGILGVSALIHIMQVIFVCSTASDLISRRKVVSNSDNVYMIPIAIWVIGTLLLGLCLHHP